jgi:hypothetical protein
VTRDRRGRRGDAGFACVARAACVVLTLLAPATALAQASPPQVQVQLDADTVGVGDVVHVQMSVTSSDAMPSDAQLGPTPGFVLRGQNASSQTQFVANGFNMDRAYTLTVDWSLQAQRVGTFSLGPLMAVVGGTRYPEQRVTLHVVPAGQAPRARPPSRPDPFGLSPFAPWRGLFPGMDNGAEPPQEPAVAVDPRLALDAPRGVYFFLHAIVDKTTAAVGEQVTFTVYEYADISAGDIEADGDSVHDAQAADFVKHPLVPEDREAPLAGFASIGGRTWQVKIVRRWALFPLHSGDLAIGPMSLTLLRPRPAAGQARTTEAFVVHVVEPPVTGRPPGFALGDVGRFALAVQVQPRDIEQGGAVGVHVELSGTGNVPEAIVPPAREGVDWLAPEVHADLGPIGQGAYGGKRTFDYVVHVARAGTVDLGEVTLPYWDPEQRKYGVARASLGALHVKPNAAAAAASQVAVASEKLSGLPPPREALEGLTGPRRHWDDSPLFWLVGVGGGPLAFGVAVAGRAGIRRARRAWVGKRTSPVAELKERMAAVRAACERSDPRAIDATITRALEAATVAHAKVGVRGALGAEVVGRLERAGVEPRVANGISDLLGECERGRFAPEASDAEASRARAARALEVIGHLEKRA